MAYLGILPRIPSFGEQFAQNVGQCLSKEVETFTKALSEHQQQKKTADLTEMATRGSFYPITDPDVSIEKEIEQIFSLLNRELSLSNP